MSVYQKFLLIDFGFLGKLRELKGVIHVVLLNLNTLENLLSDSVYWILSIWSPMILFFPSKAVSVSMLSFFCRKVLRPRLFLIFVNFWVKCRGPEGSEVDLTIQSGPKIKHLSLTYVYRLNILCSNELWASCLCTMTFFILLL